MKTLINKMVSSGQRAAAWAASQVDENGDLPGAAFKELGCYYKMVYPLRAAGHTVEASLALNRIMTLHLQDNGDLRNSAERKSAGTYTSFFAQSYINGWIALGALWLGRFEAFDTLYKGMMDNYYDEEMGVFRCCALPKVDEFDITSATMATELMMLVDMEKAVKAADFVMRLHDDQPDIAHYFYGRVGKPFSYLTDPHPVNDVYSRVKFGAEAQAQWYLGFPMAILALMYERTLEPRFLRGAERFFDTFLSSGEVVFRSPGSGKALWASSILYRLTGQQKYLDVARRVADFFFSLQQEDGSFLPPGLVPGGEGVDKASFDMTPEYARWMLDSSGELLGVCTLPQRV